MPDKRKHRGPHPQDEALFSDAEVPKLRQALRDFSWLLSRGYPEKGALKLVGDRYRLKKRQRQAVNRNACSQQAARVRQRKMVLPEKMAGRSVEIDGFNLLITIESALSGGLIFEGVDGCYRDLASVHGSYKRVQETGQAIKLIGRAMEELDIQEVHWLLDRPVSNSGKVKTTLYEIADEENWKWTVSLHYNPDQSLVESEAVAISSDSLIIDHAGRWFNAARYIIDHYLPQTKIIRFC